MSYKTTVRRVIRGRVKKPTLSGLTGGPSNAQGVLSLYRKAKSHRRGSNFRKQVANIVRKTGRK